MMVGTKIRDLRKKLGLTQEQLAGDELTKSYVSQVELGRIHPSHKALEIIASRLGKPLGYFLENGDDMRTIEVLLKAAQALWNSGRLEDGMLGLQEALTLAERTGREDILARIKATMGKLEMSQGNLDAALAHLEESLSLIHPDDHPVQAIEIANTLGMAAARHGSFHKAMNSFQQALEYAERLDTREGPNIRAEAAQHYGDFCYSQRQWVSSLELYRMALDQKQLSACRRAELLSRIAAAEWRLGHSVEASKAVDEAMMLLNEIRGAEERATLQADVAQVLIDIGRVDDARELLQSSLAVFDRVHFQEGQAVILESLLRIPASDKMLDQYAHRILGTPDSWPWHDTKILALRALARRAVSRGEFESAREYLSQALTMTPVYKQRELECEYYIVQGHLGDTTALQQLWTHLTDPVYESSEPRKFAPKLPVISTPEVVEAMN
ncbi:MAG: helix-turn-helix transcriptional regulator [Firmicutes bacterium]|jgi:tetratricopeptide (TPR) repeat protein|uniref:Transcriptional regulator n=1 Tax=Sulfobacillus benefaciens TaxID=453960 RepID=A0A2T2X7Z3_9FIRM|nr:helix-turn-helix transcriptional regulator [Bacillota bacterium]MCL5014100.1 helix-turn-helix transcriptional regulator [Bacillota bacterium]PSR30576.1 MAG: transcriptional regulator [Sulfobacillus benefaciens]HBQ93858.1 transcriptional regulator [Sulfobacillus sp.]